MGEGGLALIDTIEMVRRQGDDLRLTIAGHGPVPELLKEASVSPPWLQVMCSIGFDTLVALYCNATFFCLATRTSLSTSKPSGEGFGLVLLEAQLAGLPVIAPSSGGSASAFVESVTGLQPKDESSVALASVLRRLISDPEMLTRMSRASASWSPAHFDPDWCFAEAAHIFTTTDDGHRCGS